MEVSYKNLVKNDRLKKKSDIACSMKKAICEFIQGKIINITIKSSKLLAIYYDKDNMFLFERIRAITIKKLF
ncbi:MAG: hypothetical protein PHN72_00365 [Bacilli bacterium]|nr:hypothetical protein [Bacilli bacterium]